jgi:hypothetical protein
MPPGECAGRGRKGRGGGGGWEGSAAVGEGDRGMGWAVSQCQRHIGRLCRQVVGSRGLAVEGDPSPQQGNVTPMHLSAGPCDLAAAHTAEQDAATSKQFPVCLTPSNPPLSLRCCTLSVMTSQLPGR